MYVISGEKRNAAYSGSQQRKSAGAMRRWRPAAALSAERNNRNRQYSWHGVANQRKANINGSIRLGSINNLGEENQRKNNGSMA